MCIGMHRACSIVPGDTRQSTLCPRFGYILLVRILKSLCNSVASPDRKFDGRRRVSKEDPFFLLLIPYVKLLKKKFNSRKMMVMSFFHSMNVHQTSIAVRGTSEN
ncbi:hypothetical protein PUN28_017304 [Cardiocondyla obscurior]|uniref:Uncharacterized protein n=1 Tax=Cardiocondyla obscurior TaxID=286306 RepID=A0AAW2EL67_9HYME